jgi:guanylate kinase
VSVSTADPARETQGLPAGFAPVGFLLVVSGPSGVGKGTLVERLLAARPDCALSISATTRARRPHETDGIQYFFLSRETFEARRADGYFLEWAEVHGHLYGTPRAFVAERLREGRIVVLEVDVQGGASIRRADRSVVSVFVSPPSIESLRERLLGRGTDRPEVVQQRLRNAPAEMAQMKEYDYVVVNDDLEQATARLVAIVDAERSRVSRLRAST